MDNLRPINGGRVSFVVPMKTGSKEDKDGERVNVKSYAYDGFDNLFIHILESDRFLYIKNGDSICERRGCYTYTEVESSFFGKPELYGERYTDCFIYDSLFAKAALMFVESELSDLDLIHCHDGHAALPPFLVQNSKEFEFPSLKDIPMVLTLYNMADRYRGEVDYIPAVSKILGVDDHLLNDCVHNGQFDPVIAAGLSGAYVTVMGRNYLHESIYCGNDASNSWTIHKMLGMGIPIRAFDGGIELRETGVGVEKPTSIKDGSWSEIDPEEKPIHKTMLLNAVKIKGKNRLPLFTFVGRLSHQKGYDIMAEVFESLLGKIDFTLVGIGSGHRSVVQRLEALQRKAPENIRIFTEYDSEMARKIYAGGDFFLMPSRFEPFGTADLIAMLSANVPIVHAVGGLIKVTHGVTGYSYTGGPQKLLQTVLEAHEDYINKSDRILAIRKAGCLLVKGNYTWEKVMDMQFFDHYGAALEFRHPVLTPPETLTRHSMIANDNRLPEPFC